MRFFKKVNDIFRLPYTLAGLRTGAATRHFRLYRSIPQLMFDGRWAVERTLRHYVHSIICAFTSHQLDSSVHTLVAQVQSTLWPLFEEPPALPFDRFVGDAAAQLRRHHSLRYGRAISDERDRWSIPGR